MTSVAIEEDVEEAWKVSQVIQKEVFQLTASDKFRELAPGEKMAFCSKHQLLEAQSQAALFVNPSLSEDYGAYILGVVTHATEKVPLDMRLCMVTDTQIEWLYVFDLDENQFEIYCGLEYFEAATTRGRFDKEEFLERSIKGKTLRPSLLEKYTFEQLVGMKSNDLVSDVNAVLRRHRH